MYWLREIPPPPPTKRNKARLANILAFIFLLFICAAVWLPMAMTMLAGGAKLQRKSHECCFLSIQYIFALRNIHLSQCCYTDKKENQIFLIYKENSEWSSCKVIYEEGLPNIWGNAQIQYFSIYEEAVSDIWHCNCSILNFLIYEENFIFFFIAVLSETKLRIKSNQIKRLFICIFITANCDFE